MDFAKHQATLAAERDIAEQAYVYVKSQSEIKNGIWDHDEIIVLSEIVMKVIEVKYQILPTNDEAFIVKSNVKATIDTEEINKLIESTESEQNP